MMDMNDYQDYEQFEQVREYLAAAWLTALDTTRCVKCTRVWFQKELGELLDKAVSDSVDEHE